MDLERETAHADRAFGSVPLHERRELARVARRVLVAAEHDEVLEHRGLVREGARARDRRLHLEQHLGDHRVLADGLAHLDALRGVVGGLRERGRRDADPLDADAQA